MVRIPRGLYQLLITESLQERLTLLEAHLNSQSEALHHAEAADRLSMHLARVLEQAIDAIDEEVRVSAGTTLVRELIALAVKETSADLLSERPTIPGQFLSAVLAIQPDGRPEVLVEPLIPLLDTALLTNAPGEPRVLHQLVAEMPSSDRIDVVMAFIRRSGIGPMMDAIRRHCEAGRTVRILTTTYTGSTEGAALKALQDVGADVRVSYDTSSTRLHAKAWLFHRSSGFSTAYIGSSNLTHSAQVSGLEWNVRFSGVRNAPVVDKVAAVFDSYWHSGDFVPFDESQFEQLTGVDRNEDNSTRLSPIELRPEPFQERLLEQIALSRQRGHHRNLLVSATGTGKTVMAAIDYARLREVLPRARLLFVAHRKEILQQSLATFRHAIRDHAFGEMWVDGARPQIFDHVFASIQSLSTSGLAHLDAHHFDIVVVDEFHHAEAPTYRALLEHVQPVELLGLTATPERSDGLSLLHWFDGRIAGELRLWDAIDQRRLVPFAYYGISDSLDLREIPWRRGRGYDVEGLTRVYTANDVWARHVIQALTAKVDNVHRMRALGFCVSVDHARFMARTFNEAGIASRAIWAETPTREREDALRDLSERRVNAVFSVDIFNEGVDVPAVDTILKLRPTDSPTLFLQQLGRGLRRHHGKSICTVLDFVGQHRKEFRFDRCFGALLGGTRKQIINQIEQGFPYLPAGCHMELDRVASERVLHSIRSAVPERFTQRVEELRELAAGRSQVPLSTFLDQTGLSLEDVYGGDRCWSDFLEAAGLAVKPRGPAEVALRKACGRLLHVDDIPRIEAYRRFGTLSLPPEEEALSTIDRRYLRMLVAGLVGNAVKSDASLREACGLVWQHAQVLVELVEVMDILLSIVTHSTKSLIERSNVPLSVHARYTRIEIQAAFGDGSKARVPTWREGVRWMPDERSDVLVFTLDKTSGRFSPTTRYNDYAISRELVHWESQSTTRAVGKVGQRYQEHARAGSSVMLFARLTDADRAFYFLGPAEYVSHESEMPMKVTWRLRHSLPGDLFAAFAAAVA